MKKEEVLKSVGKLVHDINHCTGELVAARGKRDEDGISYAHWAMESLMVAAHQELTFLAEYVEGHIHDDEEVEAAFKNQDEVQYQRGFDKGLEIARKERIAEITAGIEAGRMAKDNYDGYIGLTTPCGIYMKAVDDVLAKLKGENE